MKELEYASHSLLRFLVGGRSEKISKEELKKLLYHEMEVNAKAEEEIRGDMFAYYRLRYNLSLVGSRFKHHDEGIRYDLGIRLKPPGKTETLALIQYHFDGETFTHRSDLETYVLKEDEMVLMEVLSRREESRGVKNQMKQMFEFVNKPFHVHYRAHEEKEDKWVFHLLVNDEPVVFRVRKDKEFDGMLIPTISKVIFLHDHEREKAFFTYLTETSPFRLMWLYQ